MPAVPEVLLFPLKPPFTKLWISSIRSGFARCFFRLRWKSRVGHHNAGQDAGQPGSPSLPPTLAAVVSVGPLGVPRYWATVWSDVLTTSLEASTRRKHLAAVDRLNQAVQRQRGSDCLDRLIAEADGDALEDCLVGFLAQLRKEAAIAGVDKSSTWTSAVSFVTDMLRHAGNSSGARADEIEAKLLKLETLYRQLTPNPKKPPPPIRALPPLVIEDLYEIFRPDSPRNPFRTDTLRWRNRRFFLVPWTPTAAHARIRYQNIVKALATEPGMQPFPDGKDLSLPPEKKFGNTIIDTMNRLRDLDD
ncbi:hypothetical protein NKI88_24135 [Mesorhizobium sp. M0317]|uniref:hypothetical protein n=1 Tax=Mesorhizobium sp. M0317 TaxID=2956935 RepID=UPI00333DC38D